MTRTGEGGRKTVNNVRERWKKKKKSERASDGCKAAATLSLTEKKKKTRHVSCFSCSFPLKNSPGQQQGHGNG